MIKRTLEFQCNQLSLTLGDKILFQDFNFSFKGPGIILIEGDNGVGKSSLLKTFAGFITPLSGKIKFLDNSKQILNPEMSYLTTTSLGLMSDLTGSEHIYLVGNILNLSALEIQRKIVEFKSIIIFEEVLLKKVSDQSQGMKQLLRLFLHLLVDRKIIFLDEPFLYLSPKTREEIQKKIEFLATTSLIFITDQKFSWIPVAKTEMVILGSL